MKPIYLLAVLFFVITVTHAQKRDTVHAPATAKKAKMKDQLGLNEKQAAELKASNKEYKAGKEKVDKDPKLSEADKKAKLKQLKKAKRAKKDAVLTPEQKEKARALKAAKKKEKKDS